MPRSHQSNWVSYGRAFLLTLSALFTGLQFYIWRTDGYRSAEWKFWHWILFCLIGTLAVALLLVGLFGKSRNVERWFDAATRHDASIVILIIAAPLYFLLKLMS